MKLYHINKIAVFLFALLFVFSEADALRLGKYYINKKSKLWIEGTSTVEDYTCNSYRIDGQAVLDSVPGMSKVELWGGSRTKHFLDASFKINVKSLDCGNDMMNEDMYEALKEEDNKHISFILEHVHLLKTDKKNDQVYVKVDGILKIAGKSKKHSFYAVIYESVKDVEYRIKCESKLNMKDFGIEPPSALFGLIKADEKLELFLDLYISKSDYTEN